MLYTPLTYLCGKWFCFFCAESREIRENELKRTFISINLQFTNYESSFGLPTFQTFELPPIFSKRYYPG